MIKLGITFIYLCLFYCGRAVSFEHDLHLFSIPGKNLRTMICFHGYGDNYQIAQKLKEIGLIDATLISFNFLDHDLDENNDNFHVLKYGTFEELLPAFYVLKKYVVDEALDSIDLYGYSAGGGALVNLIAILNTTTYDEQLKKMGITNKDKNSILAAIQKGIIILDTPLKSVEEIIDFRGSSKELELLAKNYRENHFRPIDSLELLEGLSLNIILHFQDPDEILFNRDDSLYIQRLKKANSNGSVAVIIQNDGGHLVPHLSLWNFYSQKIFSFKCITNRHFLQFGDKLFFCLFITKNIINISL